jgi:hypothetical protein
LCTTSTRNSLVAFRLRGIAGRHGLAEIHVQALGYCPDLADSQFAFTGLLQDTSVAAAGAQA